MEAAEEKKAAEEALPDALMYPWFCCPLITWVRDPISVVPIINAASSVPNVGPDNPSLPSNYLTVKCSLWRLFREQKGIILALQDAVDRMNRIVTEAYHLLNLHVRRLLEGKMPIPVMNKTWLRGFLCAVSTLKGKHSLPEDVEIKKTYNELYKPLSGGREITEHFAARDNLSACIDYATREMLTAITNNIQVQRC